MAAKSSKTQSFETALAELEQVVADMESGKLTLEDSLGQKARRAVMGSGIAGSSAADFGDCSTPRSAARQPEIASSRSRVSRKDNRVCHCERSDAIS